VVKAKPSTAHRPPYGRPTLLLRACIFYALGGERRESAYDEYKLRGPVHKKKYTHTRTCAHVCNPMRSLEKKSGVVFSNSAREYKNRLQHGSMQYRSSRSRKGHHSAITCFSAFRPSLDRICLAHASGGVLFKGLDSWSGRGLSQKLLSWVLAENS
jgi:hypothetical protein